MTPFIETERCVLALPSEEDAPALAAFLAANEAHFRPWDPRPPEGFYTADYWREKSREHLEDYEAGRSLRLRMFSRETGDPIGFVNYTNFERGPFQNCRLGYKIGRAHQGQGLMFEAVSASLGHVFDGLGFHRVEANYVPRNLRSGALLRRLGFEEVGVARAYLEIAGVWEDHVLTYKLSPAGA